MAFLIWSKESTREFPGEVWDIFHGDDEAWEERGLVALTEDTWKYMIASSHQSSLRVDVWGEMRIYSIILCMARKAMQSDWYGTRFKVSS